jgi:hypothetical protein
MQSDRSAWSGDGDFTIRLLDALEQFAEVEYLRVEDAPASRSGSGYNLLSNEVYVKFAGVPGPPRARMARILRPQPRPARPSLTLPALEARLAEVEGIGHADYVDEGMLQYLRTERIVPPYQTRGYKLVELVRIYSFPEA